MRRGRVGRSRRSDRRGAPSKLCLGGEHTLFFGLGLSSIACVRGVKVHRLRKTPAQAELGRGIRACTRRPAARARVALDHTSLNFQYNKDMADPLIADPLIIAGREFRSRLIVGTGKYKSFQETARALEASGAEHGDRRGAAGESGPQQRIAARLSSIRRNTFCCRILRAATPRMRRSARRGWDVRLDCRIG